MFTIYYVKALFLVLIFIGLMPLCLYAGGMITYVENFDNNVNRWFTGNDNNDRGEISNGRYVLENKQTHDKWFCLDSIPVNKNKDFEINVLLKSAEESNNYGYGLVWGMRIGVKRAFNYFVINNKAYDYGFYENNKYNHIDGWKESGVILPAPKQNLLTIKRSGNKTIRFINAFMVGESPVLPFSGNITGVYVGSRRKVEVDSLSVSTSSDKIPNGFSVVSEGSFGNNISWPNLDYEGTFRAEVFNHGRLKTEKSITSENVFVVAGMRANNEPWGAVSGAYLATGEGAMLKLERIWSTAGIKVRFSTFAQGKELGTREQVFPHNTSLVLRISRNGDIFKGEVFVDGKKTVEVGNLTWPKLSKNQTVGVMMGYDNNGTNAPESFQCEFQDFYAGGPMG
jgi:hypothetical protein